MANLCACVYDIWELSRAKCLVLCDCELLNKDFLELYENSMYVVKNMKIIGNVNDAYYLWWSWTLELMISTPVWVKNEFARHALI